MRHSGLGISSFIISTAIGVLMFLLFVIAGVLETSTPGGMDENSVEAMLVGLFLIAFLLMDLVALGLGVGGLFQRDRRKVFAVLGVVFSVGTVAITLLFLLIGMMA
ncbi:hypothetical protein [Arenimonas caeni]|jgi:hypothetical protein|uniref:DUF4064 domain-containing protein n=1 Tax=Arenimonas caeni TaxID=2058085 RepID=A0A2P6M6W3_9GAMM|nr:hypothetical protein [Arenimonas caeni]MDY0020891.1 hypothetical protein [Arenimonas caeni]PRH81716.1 hypothetical protein C6N40_10840 [Arenimonas caeni]